MAHIIRREVQVYASACERLLSDGWDPTLSQDEKDLIAYYAKEVNCKFKEPAYAEADSLARPQALQIHTNR